MQRSEIEVLVVGAGPVGMFAALLLAREGIGVRIIDEEAAAASHSYACALHPGTLQLLRHAGLEEEVNRLGRPIGSIAFYEGTSRQAVVDLSKLPLEVPRMIALPQGRLEEILAERLRAEGVGILWNHRLGDLSLKAGSAVATIDRLGGTSTGYIVPRWETIVTTSWRADAAYVIGADGHDSAVRRALGIDCETVGKPELFVLYEFESPALPDEVRVVFDHGMANVLWPLPRGRCRWSFQWPEADEDVFPHKDRRLIWYEDSRSARRTRDHLRMLVEARAPWFSGHPDQVEWAADVQFEPSLAARFGRERGWLAGDAAHQTGPIGMQSMNIGLREAAHLAGCITRILRQGASEELLEEYGRTRREEWLQLLGVQGKLEVEGKSSAFQGGPPARLLSCLPGSGEDVALMLRQIGLTLKLPDARTAGAAAPNPV